jgi:hypothetical protein
MFNVTGAEILNAIRDHGATNVLEIIRALRLPSGPSRWKLEASSNSVAIMTSITVTICGNLTLDHALNSKYSH